MPVSYFAGRLSSYTVGRDSLCNLVIDDTFVSRRHLTLLSVTCDVAGIRVSGRNGAQISGRKVNSGYKGYVRAGDPISIGPYTIIWMGEDTKGGGVFCRASKRLPGPDTTPVEIEGPPPRKAPEKPSVMLAAGPALTMAIPILLGARRSVAVLSSVFAFMWAAANVMFRIRKQRSEERRRRNIYTAYLEECVNTLRERASKAVAALSSMFPPLDSYFRAGGDPMLIWNCDPEGCSYPVRVGTGRVENPVTVIIPKERFAGIDDSLKELPGQIKEKYAYVLSAPIRIPLDDQAFTVFVIESDEDIRQLSSFILQIAASYTPGQVCLMQDVSGPLKENIGWMAFLPHYAKGAKECDNAELTVSVTSDINLGYALMAKGHRVILAADPALPLPKGIATVVNRGSDNYRDSIRYDSVELPLCYSYASSLAGLWTEDANSSEPPSVVPFSEMIDSPVCLADISAIREQLLTGICSYWAACDVTSFIGAPIGVAAGARKVILDLHEKAAGPHGLIAGTTGSGKSELLTTIILSFAVRYPADKLGFFLIDYKGGGMSNLFSSLPHLLGSISNLSQRQALRAMKALKSENLRRQRIFAAHSVNNINDYTKLYDAGKAATPLPHILLIVDEFAELKRETPDFMDSLISISQVGRSLGIHLILATQKPSGVIDDKIRGNSGFRIALRLVDRNDSTDLIGIGDAATIKECGRAYLQVGNDPEFVLFQSAYAMSGAPGKNKIRIFSDPFCENEIIREEEEQKDTATWFDLVMNAVCSAAERTQIKPVDPLWLPELADDVEDERAFALFDNVYMQSYEKAVYDPIKYGHVLITGKSGTGKSEMLLSIITHMEDAGSFYVIDHGGGRLRSLKSHFACGGVVNEEDTADIIRMTGFICDIVNDRRRQRPDTAEEMGKVILVLDDISAIKTAADEEFSDHIVTILTFGKAVNVYMIATSLGTPLKEEKLFDTLFLLGNPDIYSVASAFKVSSSAVPGVRDIPGRGVGMWENMPLEFMTVRPRKITGRAPPGHTAKHFPHVSANPCLEELLQEAKATGVKGIPIGFFEKSGRLYCLRRDMADCFLIAGKPYSGRHTLLFNISLIAEYYGIKTVRADTYEAFICAAKDSDSKTMIITESVKRLLDDFYERARGLKEEEEFALLLRNPLPGQKVSHIRPMVVALIENEVSLRYAGRKIYEALAEHPFGIVMGGCLDEARIFDWKMLPYSALSKPLKRGVGTLSSLDEKHERRDVIVPGIINVDNLQTL